MDIRETSRRYLYVGRTGDSSSCHASSPFRRVGQHLQTKLNAKGNAMGKQLKAVGISPHSCTFEMVAFGPLFEEETTIEKHRLRRDEIAALERALADELGKRGYTILGTHPKKRETNDKILNDLILAIDGLFPKLPSVSGAEQ